MRTMLVSVLGAALLTTSLSGCGKSEEEIRADERAKMSAAADDEDIESDADFLGDSDGREDADELDREARSSGGGGGKWTVDTYTAFIDPDYDVYNSGGSRLNSVAAILQQDRANVNKGITQTGDTRDSYFTSRAARNQMASMVSGGWVDPVTADLILEGDIDVQVAILEKNGRKFVEVTSN